MRTLRTVSTLAVGRRRDGPVGGIYWAASTGAHEVHGAILAKYIALGGMSSKLGAPATDEYSVPTGRRSNFVHGAIVWNATTNVVTVIYS